MKRNVIAQIQKGLNLEHYTSLKPGPGPKLETDTGDTADTFQKLMQKNLLPLI